MLNGEPRQFADDALSVASLVMSLGYSGKRIAVERNGLIVPKSQYDATSIVSGDRIEIVIAVGGG